MHEPICATYTYLSLTEYLARMMNTRQQEKDGLVEYVERFKQEKSIVKISIGENVLGSFVKRTKELKNMMKWKMQMKTLI